MARGRPARLLPERKASNLLPMRKLRLLRVAHGMPCMLLAMLLLFAQMVAPAMALQLRSADPAGQLALQTICHIDAPGTPAQPVQRDCLLCPACHLGSQVALPTPTVPPVPPSPATAAIDIGAPLPPATRARSRFRATAQPTGPPIVSI